MKDKTFHTFYLLLMVFKVIETKDPKVYLSVSAIARIKLFEPAHQRKIVINYYDLDCERINRPNSFIGFYSHDPRKNTKSYIFTFNPKSCPDGKIKTNSSLPFFDFTKDDLVEAQCLGFWAAYIESGKVIHSSCISTHPNWMYQMKDNISEKSLNCLMIPGTHNSGCYARYNPFWNTVYEKYIFTQEENIFNQLVYGIRYLDLRIWHQKNWLGKSNIIITHDKYHWGLPQLRDVLQQVKDFVTSTNEIVIIDFHRKLTGRLITSPMKEWQNQEVIDLLKSVFGPLLIDSTFKTASYKILWRMNKRVLITYTDFNEKYVDDVVSYRLRHWWINSLQTSEVHRYLAGTACSNKYSLSVAAAFLTPNKWTPLTDVNFSRRKAAEEINELTNKWFRKELSCSNIIMTDYFLGNNIIDIAIEENNKYHYCPRYFLGYFYN